MIKAEAVAPPLPPTIGRYELLERLGEGGCGTVFRGHDPMLGRDVAIKVAHPDPPDTVSAGCTPSERLVAEGRTLRSISSRHVVRALDAGTIDTRAYLVMELAAAGPLSQRLTAGLTGDPVTTAALGTALADGLGAAHRVGIVHCDVTPTNLLIDGPARAVDAAERLIRPDERVLVGDFGIAGTTEAAAAHDFRMQGTRLYRAPEQECRTSIIGPAVDVYGATAVIVSVIGGGLPPAPHDLAPLLSCLRPRWRDFVATGMHADPAQRFASMRDWRTSLFDAINHDLTEAGFDALA